MTTMDDLLNKVTLQPLKSGDGRGHRTIKKEMKFWARFRSPISVLV